MEDQSGGDRTNQQKGELKQWFREQMQKRHAEVKFEFRPVGPPGRQRFLCELRVEGWPYTGVGNSSTKKEADYNAIKDYCQYLIRMNVFQPQDIPGMDPNSGCIITPNVGASTGPSRSVFEPGMRPDTMGEAYRPFHQGPQSREREYTYKDQLADRQRVTDAEELDLTAAIHGNWTIETAKSRLHTFLQEEKIKDVEYKFTRIGSDHSSTFVAEKSIYVRKLNRMLHARESASNKITASKSCALSLVRQLYHLGVIEAFSGTLKRNKQSQIKPFQIRLPPSLIDEVRNVLNINGVQPASVDFKEGEPKSLVTSTVIEEFLASQPQPAGVVSWSPPAVNWNPWTSCNIDEGPLATASLKNISSEFMEERMQRIKEDTSFFAMLEKRKQLPIYQVKEQILSTIYENKVVLIMGNTGCGKTTQVCQYILDDYIESEQGASCNIVVTQPRRISAMSVSDRVAAERCESLGISSGFSVRFESQLPRPFGAILFCTVGVLLKKLEQGLRGISHVIVDEIHERDVNTDFILVILRDMVHCYPDLRVILMSATVDINLFRKYFNNCPVIEIEGRTFPVEQYFLEDVLHQTGFKPVPDPKKKKKKRDEKDEEEELIKLAGEDNENLNLVCDSRRYDRNVAQRMALLSESSVSFELIEHLLVHLQQNLKITGALLIFLPGWSLIFSLLKHLQMSPHLPPSRNVFLPLHSQLPREDQRRVFEPVPAGVNKIILSTNIAETSITIDDVVAVIDLCRAKIKLFTAHNNMVHYANVWASRSNLEQRKGRAGRVQPGVCYHLCSRARYEKLEEHLAPEMFRTPLHEIALAIKVLNLGPIGQFLSKAIEPPPIDAVIEAEVSLRELKCLDKNDELTPLGRILGRLPVEPRLGRMLVLACLMRLGDSMAAIVAYASNMSEIFILQPFKKLTGRQRSWAGNLPHSDHIAVLNAYQEFESIYEHSGPTAAENFCDREQISLPTMKILSEAKRQLTNLLITCGFPEESLNPLRVEVNRSDLNTEVIAALLSWALYPNVAYHMEKRKVVTTGGKLALINKGSVNCPYAEYKFPLPFFVYGEKVRTRAISCKQLTMVSPIHLLLFASRRVDVSAANQILLDNWIPLDIELPVAAEVVALRPIIEGLIVKASKDPVMCSKSCEEDERTIRLLRNLCAMTLFISPDSNKESGNLNNSFKWRGHGGYGPPTKREGFMSGGNFRPGIIPKEEEHEEMGGPGFSQSDFHTQGDFSSGDEGGYNTGGDGGGPDREEYNPGGGGEGFVRRGYHYRRDVYNNRGSFGFSSRGEGYHRGGFGYGRGGFSRGRGFYGGNVRGGRIMGHWRGSVRRGPY